jgi:hypothetical protein
VSDAAAGPDLPPRRRTLVRAALAAGLVAAVAAIYSDAAFSSFFDDDFHWLAQTRRFEFANLFRLERYDHFYRPIIELYFLAGLNTFGCNPLPFHIASIVIHLTCTLVLFQLARALSGRERFALLSAAFFAVQPGYVQAVTWIGAITDLLPALWYLLALWMHVRFLQTSRQRDYFAALAAFTACLLTHESAATLLPMMLALDVAVAPGTLRERLSATLRRAPRYAPFLVLLLAFLAIAWTVNTRSYLVREGHYAFGWHAIPHALDYVVSLYVGKRILPSYLAIVAFTAAVLVKGTPLTRLLVVWIFATLAPVSFFTWGNASRYLYVPAAGFAMLLADLGLAAYDRARIRWPVRWVRPIALALAAAVIIRFALFAHDGADGFRTQTQPYERLLATIERTGQRSAPNDEIVVTAADLYGVPELYRDGVAETAACRPGVRLVVR